MIPIIMKISHCINTDHSYNKDCQKNQNMKALF